MSVNPIPEELFALVRHTQEDTHTSSFDGFQLSRIDKHIHIYMYTHSPASYTESTYYSIAKAFRTTRLQSLSKISNILPFLPCSIPGKVTGLYFTCLDLEGTACLVRLVLVRSLSMFQFLPEKRKAEKFWVFYHVGRINALIFMYSLLKV